MTGACKYRKGFTLIELLVVITIIAIIAVIFLSVTGDVEEKIRIKKTKAVIAVLQLACETYKADFSVYPDINSRPNNPNAPAYNGDTLLALDQGGFDSVTTAQNGNKRLRYLLSFTAVVDEVVVGPYLQNQNLSTDDQGTEDESDDLFVDAWGNFLRILPGRNHSSDNPIGPNFFNATRARTPLDIYSAGVDGRDNTNGDYTSTNFNFNEEDDITSWFIGKAR